MPFLKPFQGLFSLIQQKRLGRPMLCGWAMCSWSQCGEENPCAGVYQQRYPRLDFWTKGYTPKGRRSNFVMRPCWPSQPPSEARDAQQAKFVTALRMWQALTTQQKKFYNDYATRISKRGYDYFMSKTLKSL